MVHIPFTFFPSVARTAAFQRQMYRVSEGAGVATVGIVMNGQSAVPITLVIFTNAGSATGMISICVPLQHDHVM